jgi:hydroxyacyl-ACP dehydratase HTD2-like protein with hotdog domain
MPARQGAPLPPLWHWLNFLPLHRASEIGPDGHACRGGFLPPVPLPRRMWAGSRFEFHAPLQPAPDGALWQREIVPDAVLLALRHRREPGAPLASFKFRAPRPAFDGEALRLCGRREGAAVHLWAQGPEGSLRMDATATLLQA